MLPSIKGVFRIVLKAALGIEKTSAMDFIRGSQGSNLCRRSSPCEGLQGDSQY